MEELTLADRQKAQEAERVRLEPKAIHIKQSRREVVQLFRNLFVFYDKEIEDRLAPGENIISRIYNALNNQCFPRVSRPAKIVNQLMAAIATIKHVNSLKTKDCVMGETDFVRHFVSEHLIGAT